MRELILIMQAPESAFLIGEVARVLDLEGQAILDCSQKIRHTDAGQLVLRAVQILHQCLEGGGKIVVTGVGKSGKIAQKIAATFSSTGSLATYLHPTEGLHGDLGILREKDAVLALSYTGNTEELLKLLPSVKSRGVQVIGCGGNPASRLAELCDVWIDARVEQEACPHNLAPTASTTLALALGDALAVALMQVRGFSSDAFALNHPGGALGKRLTLRVQDLMTPMHQVAVVRPEAGLDEVIEGATQKRWGAVLVMDHQELLGIITDGDIRRSLKHKEKIFQMQAKSLMTAEPVVARSDQMAYEALALMENRPNQIHVLPVKDASGQCIGLLRLHDLVRTF